MNHSSEAPPIFDQDGLNILDPHDKLGRKSDYITQLQALAIKRYFPQGNNGLCLDVGCGYGRLSSILAQKNWQVIGIDPDVRLVQYAQRHSNMADFCAAALPHMPVAKQSVDCFVLHNVVRVFHLIGKMELIKQVGEYVKPNGWLIVVDNVRQDHPNYLPETNILEAFKSQQFKLVEQVPIRLGRWWLIYLIRYGLIPSVWLPRIAAYELDKRRHQTNIPRFSYLTKIYLFQKEDVDEAVPAQS